MSEELFALFYKASHFMSLNIERNQMREICTLLKIFLTLKEAKPELYSE